MTSLLWTYATGALCLFALAAVVGFRGFGVRIAVLSAVLPALGWLAHFFTVDASGSAELADGLAQAIFWAALSGAILGTLGHAVGLAARRRRTGETLPVWIAGTDSFRTRRGLVVAIGLFAASFGFLTALGLAGVTPPTPVQSLVLWLSAVLVTGLSVLSAYRNGGLVTCWAIWFGPTFGFFLNAFGQLEPAGAAFAAVYGGGIALGLAAILGTVAFVLGTGLRRTFGARGSASTSA
jgi:hypothetical protein